MSGNTISTELLVLGSGPAGYAAAFRAADLGKQVVLVEKSSELGGTCLNVGCIPSKALLHAAKVSEEAKEASKYGLTFGDLSFDINKLRNWKNATVQKLAFGLKSLAKLRKVAIIAGEGKFIGANSLIVTNAGQTTTTINFQYAIIASGSNPITLPFLPKDPRVIDSTNALELTDIPKHLLVIGAGIIGLEMATFYRAFGSKVTVVEFMEHIIPNQDLDMVKPLLKRLTKQGVEILLKVKVTKAETTTDNNLVITVENQNQETQTIECDRILVAVGRKANSSNLGLEQLGIPTNAKGSISVNEYLQTSLPHIYACGDIIGDPMLAHKATFEGRLAAENIAGQKKVAKPKCIPSVAYTDPEVASVGYTEKALQEQNIPYQKALFPWLANGRAATLMRQEGMTKLLFAKDSKKLLGAAITGYNAGDLIGELALAINMNATIDDIADTIHPHPTLCETVGLAAEVAAGTVTDIMNDF